MAWTLNVKRKKKHRVKSLHDLVCKTWKCELRWRLSCDPLSSLVKQHSCRGIAPKDRWQMQLYVQPLSAVNSECHWQLWDHLLEELGLAINWVMLFPLLIIWIFQEVGKPVVKNRPAKRTWWTMVETLPIHPERETALWHNVLRLWWKRSYPAPVGQRAVSHAHSAWPHKGPARPSWVFSRCE